VQHPEGSTRSRKALEVHERNNDVETSWWLALVALVHVPGQSGACTCLVIQCVHDMSTAGN
jgi:hypothetical protein